MDKETSHLAASPTFPMLNSSLFLNLKESMCMNILPAGIYVHHIYAVSSAEEAIGFPGTGPTDGGMDAEKETQSSTARAASILDC